MLKLIDLYSGYAFGGFVRSHVSGKPWSDLDICIPSPFDMYFKNNCIQFICFNLSLNRSQCRMQFSRSRYGHGCKTMILHMLSTDTMIKIDITVNIDAALRDRTVVRLWTTRRSHVLAFETYRKQKTTQRVCGLWRISARSCTAKCCASAIKDSRFACENYFQLKLLFTVVGHTMVGRQRVSQKDDSTRL